MWVLLAIVGWVLVAAGLLWAWHRAQPAPRPGGHAPQVPPRRLVRRIGGDVVWGDGPAVPRLRVVSEDPVPAWYGPGVWRILDWDAPDPAWGLAPLVSVNLYQEAPGAWPLLHAGAQPPCLIHLDRPGRVAAVPVYKTPQGPVVLGGWTVLTIPARKEPTADGRL
jgi:hypothetical protein